MREFLIATVATIGLFAVNEPDYRLEPRDFPPRPAIGSPEADSWVQAAEMSLKAHRQQVKADRAWLRARLAWSRHEAELDR